jgi:hypothetical protein
VRHDHPHAAWNFSATCRQCRRELETQKAEAQARNETFRLREEARAEEAGFRHLVSPRRRDD